MHVNQCWACRDSRAVCNRVRPRCARCARSNRSCHYGLRLSWPKGINKKRSLTHSVQGIVGTAKRFSQTSFVNATSWDIQLHDYLRMNQGFTSLRTLPVTQLILQGIGFGSHTGYVFQRLAPSMALSWLPTSLGYEDRELIDHFICTASSTLAIFDSDKNEFLGLLLRLALSDSSPSSVAVLQSALALSSIHRHGLQASVFRFKARALRTLIVSSKNCVESPTVVQHIAANMILCHLEMLGIPNTLSLWFCHLIEAKTLIDNAGLDSKSFQGEFSRLLNWVEYHMVMSRFSHRHWYINGVSTRGVKGFAPVDQETCHSRKVKTTSHCSHELLRRLCNMFDMIRKPTDSLYHSNEYENSLRCLENKITSAVPLAPKGISDTTSDMSPAWVATMELLKVAALIYLKRASRNFSGTSLEIDAMVEKAHILFDDLETFNLAFPLLIIGCEARTDEQRMRILEHIERAMRSSNLRSLHGLQNILQQIWVQDDLAVDYELDYLTRLDAVISSYRIMPSFV
ncbi:fungal-specific transcription factor domain-containing protein [Lipomyces kononenkoae]|uniref:Fungal-specific transcription factor domain-containing protein n=1 Tax=Lipomyces kononenkoae TaxID=34357 RepID=A0ACC3SX76_LIPKO